MKLLGIMRKSRGRLTPGLLYLEGLSLEATDCRPFCPRSLETLTVHVRSNVEDLSDLVTSSLPDNEQRDQSYAFRLDSGPEGAINGVQDI